MDNDSTDYNDDGWDPKLLLEPKVQLTRKDKQVAEFYLRLRRVWIRKSSAPSSAEDDLVSNADSTQSAGNDTQSPTNGLDTKRADLVSQLCSTQSPANVLDTPTADLVSQLHSTQSAGNDTESPANGLDTPMADLVSQLRSTQSPANVLDTATADLVSQQRSELAHSECGEPARSESGDSESLNITGYRERSSSITSAISIKVEPSLTGVHRQVQSDALVRYKPDGRSRKLISAGCLTILEGTPKKIWPSDVSVTRSSPTKMSALSELADLGVGVVDSPNDLVSDSVSVLLSEDIPIPDFALQSNFLSPEALMEFTNSPEKVLFPDDMWGFSDSDPTDWLYTEERDILDDCMETVIRIRRVKTQRPKITNITYGLRRTGVMEEELTDAALLLPSVDQKCASISVCCPTPKCVAAIERVEECVSEMVPIKIDSLKTSYHCRDAALFGHDTENEVTTVYRTVEDSDISLMLGRVDGVIASDSYDVTARPLATRLHYSIEESEPYEVEIHQHYECREVSILLVDLKVSHPEFLYKFRRQQVKKTKENMTSTKSHKKSSALLKPRSASAVRPGQPSKVATQTSTTVKNPYAKIRKSYQSKSKSNERQTRVMSTPLNAEIVKDKVLLSKFENDSASVKQFNEITLNAFESTNLDELLGRAASSAPLPSTSLSDGVNGNIWRAGAMCFDDSDNEGNNNEGNDDDSLFISHVWSLDNNPQSLRVKPRSLSRETAVNTSAEFLGLRKLRRMLRHDKSVSNAVAARKSIQNKAICKPRAPLPDVIPPIPAYGDDGMDNPSSQTKSSTDNPKLVNAEGCSKWQLHSTQLDRSYRKARTHIMSGGKLGYKEWSNPMYEFLASIGPRDTERLSVALERAGNIIEAEKRLFIVSCAEQMILLREQRQYEKRLKELHEELGIISFSEVKEISTTLSKEPSENRDCSFNAFTNNAPSDLSEICSLMRESGIAQAEPHHHHDPDDESTKDFGQKNVSQSDIGIVQDCVPYVLGGIIDFIEENVQSNIEHDSSGLKSFGSSLSTRLQNLDSPPVFPYLSEVPDANEGIVSHGIGEHHKLDSVIVKTVITELVNEVSSIADAESLVGHQKADHVLDSEVSDPSSREINLSLVKMEQEVGKIITSDKTIISHLLKHMVLHVSSKVTMPNSVAVNDVVSDVTLETVCPMKLSFQNEQLATMHDTKPHLEVACLATGKQGHNIVINTVMLKGNMDFVTNSDSDTASIHYPSEIKELMDAMTQQIHVGDKCNFDDDVINHLLGEMVLHIADGEMLEPKSLVTVNRLRMNGRSNNADTCSLTPKRAVESQAQFAVWHDDSSTSSKICSESFRSVENDTIDLCSKISLSTDTAYSCKDDLFDTVFFTNAANTNDGKTHCSTPIGLSTDKNDDIYGDLGLVHEPSAQDAFAMINQSWSSSIDQDHENNGDGRWYDQRLVIDEGRINESGVIKDEGGLMRPRHSSVNDGDYLAKDFDKPIGMPESLSSSNVMKHTVEFDEPSNLQIQGINRSQNVDMATSATDLESDADDDRLVIDESKIFNGVSERVMSEQVPVVLSDVKMPMNGNRFTVNLLEGNAKDVNLAVDSDTHTPDEDEANAVGHFQPLVALTSPSNLISHQICDKDDCEIKIHNSYTAVVASNQFLSGGSSTGNGAGAFTLVSQTNDILETVQDDNRKRNSIPQLSCAGSSLIDFANAVGLNRVTGSVKTPTYQDMGKVVINTNFIDTLGLGTRLDVQETVNEVVDLVAQKCEPDIEVRSVVNHMIYSLELDSVNFGPTCKQSIYKLYEQSYFHSTKPGSLRDSWPEIASRVPCVRSKTSDESPRLDDESMALVNAMKLNTSIFSTNLKTALRVISLPFNKHVTTRVFEMPPGSLEELSRSLTVNQLQHLRNGFCTVVASFMNNKTKSQVSKARQKRHKGRKSNLVVNPQKFELSQVCETSRDQVEIKKPESSYSAGVERRKKAKAANNTDCDRLAPISVTKTAEEEDIEVVLSGDDSSDDLSHHDHSYHSPSLSASVHNERERQRRAALKELLRELAVHTPAVRSKITILEMAKRKIADLKDEVSNLLETHRKEMCRRANNRAKIKNILRKHWVIPKVRELAEKVLNPHRYCTCEEKTSIFCPYQYRLIHALELEASDSSQQSSDMSLPCIGKLGNSKSDYHCMSDKSSVFWTTHATSLLPSATSLPPEPTVSANSGAEQAPSDVKQSGKEEFYEECVAFSGQTPATSGFGVKVLRSKRVEDAPSQAGHSPMSNTGHSPMSNTKDRFVAKHTIHATNSRNVTVGNQPTNDQTSNPKNTSVPQQATNGQTSNPKNTSVPKQATNDQTSNPKNTSVPKQATNGLTSNPKNTSVPKQATNDQTSNPKIIFVLNPATNEQISNSKNTPVVKQATGDQASKLKNASVPKQGTNDQTSSSKGPYYILTQATGDQTSSSKDASVPKQATNDQTSNLKCASVSKHVTCDKTSNAAIAAFVDKHATHNKVLMKTLLGGPNLGRKIGLMGNFVLLENNQLGVDVTKSTGHDHRLDFGELGPYSQNPASKVPSSHFRIVKSLARSPTHAKSPTTAQVNGLTPAIVISNAHTASEWGNAYSKGRKPFIVHRNFINPIVTQNTRVMRTKARHDIQRVLDFDDTSPGATIIRIPSANGKVVGAADAAISSSLTSPGNQSPVSTTVGNLKESRPSILTEETNTSLVQFEVKSNHFQKTYGDTKMVCSPVNALVDDREKLHPKIDIPSDQECAQLSLFASESEVVQSLESNAGNEEFFNPQVEASIPRNDVIPCSAKGVETSVPGKCGQPRHKSGHSDLSSVRPKSEESCSKTCVDYNVTKCNQTLDDKDRSSSGLSLLKESTVLPNIQKKLATTIICSDFPAEDKVLSQTHTPTGKPANHQSKNSRQEIVLEQKLSKICYTRNDCTTIYRGYCIPIRELGIPFRAFTSSGSCITLPIKRPAKGSLYTFRIVSGKRKGKRKSCKNSVGVLGDHFPREASSKPLLPQTRSMVDGNDIQSKVSRNPDAGDRVLVGKFMSPQRDGIHIYKPKKKNCAITSNRTTSMSNRTTSMSNQTTSMSNHTVGENVKAGRPASRKRVATWKMGMDDGEHVLTTEHSHHPRDCKSKSAVESEPSPRKKLRRNLTMTLRKKKRAGQLCSSERNRDEEKRVTKEVNEKKNKCVSKNPDHSLHEHLKAAAPATTEATTEAAVLKRKLDSPLEIDPEDISQKSSRRRRHRGAAAIRDWNESLVDETILMHHQQGFGSAKISKIVMEQFMVPYTAHDIRRRLFKITNTRGQLNVDKKKSAIKQHRPVRAAVTAESCNNKRTFYKISEYKSCQDENMKDARLVIENVLDFIVRKELPDDGNRSPSTRRSANCEGDRPSMEQPSPAAAVTLAHAEPVSGVLNASAMVGCPTGSEESAVALSCGNHRVDDLGVSVSDDYLNICISEVTGSDKLTANMVQPDAHTSISADAGGSTTSFINTDMISDDVVPNTGIPIIILDTSDDEKDAVMPDV